MAGIGACDIEDIALSVLTTVIGRQREGRKILVDAGWMAMSRDRGTMTQNVDQGYGLICDLDGEVMPNLVLSAVNQEHGIVTVGSGSGRGLPDLPIGTQVRILPNHSCATASQHSAYNVLTGDADQPLLKWSRFAGW
jgi:D-serine deaminase-like pyridoxal phosphate-dependent protein